MARMPLSQRGRALRRASCRDEHPVLGLVPVDRGLVHVVPRELVEEQEQSEPRKLVKRGSQRIDVMQDAAGDDCIERPGIIQFLQGDLPVEGTLRRMWIDREHVVTSGGQRRCDTAFMATADLEHPTGRLG